LPKVATFDFDNTGKHSKTADNIAKTQVKAKISCVSNKWHKDDWRKYGNFTVRFEVQVTREKDITQYTF
jgi:hypothetical protein